jgi:hypothetical protein
VGAFSADEYTYYSLSSSELNKRIIQIVTQRVQDSLAEIL